MDHTAWVFLPVFLIYFLCIAYTNLRNLDGMEQFRFQIQIQCGKNT